MRIFHRLGKKSGAIMLSAAVVLLLILGVLTWRQCRIYTNMMTLWEDTLSKNPESWLAHVRICRVLTKEGKLDESRVHLEQAIELASYMKKILEQALPHYHRAIEIAKTKGDDYFTLGILQRLSLLEKSKYLNNQKPSR
jgi:hypothetical protein